MKKRARNPIFAEIAIAVLFLFTLYAGTIWASTESEESKHIGAQE